MKKLFIFSLLIFFVSVVNVSANMSKEKAKMYMKEILQNYYKEGWELVSNKICPNCKGKMRHSVNTCYPKSVFPYKKDWGLITYFCSCNFCIITEWVSKETQVCPNGFYKDKEDGFFKREIYRGSLLF